LKILPFKSVTYLLLVSNIFVSGLSLLGETITADIVIYGGTSAGVSAAVQAKRMGRSVVLVSPYQRLGGMTSNGLGSVDSSRQELVGGIAREFYHRVWRHYQSPDSWKWERFEDFGNRGQGTSGVDGDQRTMWVFEPNVAEDIFNSFIQENGIQVFRNEWLNREEGLEMDQNEIISFTSLSGTRFVGKIFIDCTYEGDLMAAVGIPYKIGREGNKMYGETFNGVQTSMAKRNQFINRIDPYVVRGDPTSGLLAGVSDWSPHKDGSSDNKVPAYKFHLCLTKVEENREPFTKPDLYDPRQYELLLRTLNRGSRHILGRFDPIPNAKTNTDQNGAFSTDFLGANYLYPDGTYQERSAIIDSHINYLRGYFYFLINDLRVPAEIREEVSSWGLARDEFMKNGFWPEQIHVYEARRMIGESILTEHHVMGRREVNEPIALVSAPISSNHFQRYNASDDDGNQFVQNEGDIWVEIQQPYAIPFKSILPQGTICNNLLVPVCLSASHVAYSSIRSESVFMILGQAAATSAVLAVEAEFSLHNLPYQMLRNQLIDDGQILELQKLSRVTRGYGLLPQSLGGVVVDGQMVELEGNWIKSSSMRPFVGESYYHDGNGNKGLCSARFPFVAPMDGLHEIKVSFSAFGNRAGNLNYCVKHEGGEEKILVDQRKPPSIEDFWVSLGSFNFKKGVQYDVSLNNQNTEGYVVVDAIQVVGLTSGPLFEESQ
jgi:hypothetical protein